MLTTMLLACHVDGKCFHTRIQISHFETPVILLFLIYVFNIRSVSDISERGAELEMVNPEQSYY